MNHDKSAPLWTPSPQQVEASQLHGFMRDVETRTDLEFEGYQSFWQWSVDHSDKFWSVLWDEMGVVGDKGARALVDGEDMLSARFFPDARVNYAENMLRKHDDDLAMVFRAEQGEDVKITYAELHARVSVWQQALKDVGVGQGDRVAGYMPNMPETIIAMLATASLGAIWASASPDFGQQGVIDRFGQIEPTVLVCVDGYYYNGKEIDCLEKVKAIQPALNGLKATVVVPFLTDAPDLSGLANAVTQDGFCDAYTPKKVEFERVGFNHPLFIMFSSGTTGAPKCIVHGHGGVLLQHLKEHQLQSDIRSGDRVFYFTTCGWMMWNWLASGLGSGATLMLYDGSPFYPNGNVLWDYAVDYKCTFFGTSAKYIDALKQGGFVPCQSHDLSALRTIPRLGHPSCMRVLITFMRILKKTYILRRYRVGRILCLVSCLVIQYHPFTAVSFNVQGLAWMLRFLMVMKNLLLVRRESWFVCGLFRVCLSSFGMMRVARDIAALILKCLIIFGRMVIGLSRQSIMALSFMDAVMRRLIRVVYVSALQRYIAKLSRLRACSNRLPLVRILREMCVLFFLLFCKTGGSSMIIWLRTLRRLFVMELRRVMFPLRLLRLMIFREQKAVKLPNSLCVMSLWGVRLRILKR